MSSTDHNAPHSVVFSTPVTSSLLTPIILLNAATYNLEFKDPRHHGTTHSVNEMKCENVNYSAARMGLNPLYRSVNTFKPNRISTKHARFTRVTSKQKTGNISKTNRTFETRPAKCRTYNGRFYRMKKRCRAASVGWGGRVGVGDEETETSNLSTSCK